MAYINKLAVILKKMSLKGQTVRIIISEPWDWTENLFGTIQSDRGGEKLLVKLSKSITGKKITSYLIELHPRIANEKFKLLSQYYSITVNGALINENLTDFDFIIIGSVTLD